jgi:hypothetical protein
MGLAADLRRVKAEADAPTPTFDGPDWGTANRRFHGICSALPTHVTDALREEIKRHHGASSWTNLDARTIHRWANRVEAQGAGSSARRAYEMLGELSDR